MKIESVEISNKGITREYLATNDVLLFLARTLQKDDKILRKSIQKFIDTFPNDA